MNVRAFVLSSILFTAGLAAGAAVTTRVATQPVAPAPPAAADAQCGAEGASQVRTTLYFGTTRPTGAVSELEWQLFVRDQVTTRFPAGLTTWEAHGQWRRPDGVIDQERSKVLLLVHPDTAAARASVQDVIALYRKLFDQQAVLWETARVCVAF